MKGKIRYILLLFIAIICIYLMAYRLLRIQKDFVYENFDLRANFVDSINFNDLNKLKTYRRVIAARFRL